MTTAGGSDDIGALMTGRIAPDPAVTGLSSAFLPSPTIQNHAANLAFLPGGTLACAWFGGTMEGMGDISVYLSRLAPGTDRWSVPEKLSGDPDRSEQNPLLFPAPDGRLWLIHTAQTAGRQEGAAVIARISDDGGRSFSPPRPLCDFPGIFVRQPVAVAPSGDWLLPAFRCVAAPGDLWRGDLDTAAVLRSGDRGRTWRVEDVPGSLGAVHMNIVPLDGAAMLAFYRNRYAQTVLRSQSDDGGRSWSVPAPIDLPNNNSSIQAVALQDGRIAMVYNHCNAAMSKERRQSLYDEIGTDGEAAAATMAAARPAIWGVPRAPLSLAFSRDGGLTFPDRCDLETGDGSCLSNNSRDGLNRELSYPSVVEGPDGRLHVAFTYHRRAIKYLRLDPVPSPTIG